MARLPPLKSAREELTRLIRLTNEELSAQVDAEMSAASTLPQHFAAAREKLSAYAGRRREG